jgi:MYXO-CTERM domain-containing protein
MWMLAMLFDPARACSPDEAEVLDLDPSSTDDVPPAPPELRELLIMRGHRGSSAACADVGFVDLELTRPAADPDGEDDVGYLFDLIEGDLPGGLRLPREPLLGPFVSLDWIDRATRAQEPLDFTLAVIPVDVAGNEGEPLLVPVSHEGRERESGCSTAPDAGLWALLVALGLSRRARRPTR